MFTRVVAVACVLMMGLLWLRGDWFLAFVFFLAACMLIVRESNTRRA